MSAPSDVQHDDGVPPGWDYNPSVWSQRIPIVVLALVGTAVAAYLGAFQLELIDSVWEPFFGDGSETVLTSKTSEVLPVPDGVLGALSYLLDAVTGVLLGVRRWRTAPWIVVIFGLAVGPLGAVSILLVILQPVLYDSYCTLCLASAVISMAMIGPALDEMLASCQYLKRVHTRGGSVWSAFWGSKDEVERDVALAGDPLMWARIVAVVAGLWLMASPAIFGYVGTTAETSDRIVGPVGAAISFVAIWAVCRALRWATLPLGVWLVFAPWFLGFPIDASLNSVVIGITFIVTAPFRGRVEDRLGGGWSSLTDPVPGTRADGS